MTVDLEDQLRQVFNELPDGAPDSSAATERALSRAGVLRRRRSLRVISGVTASAAAIAAAGLVGTTLHASTATGEFHPAATSTVGSAAPHATASGTPRVPGSEDTSRLYQNKRIAGLDGKLLPHGGQLPPGLRYAAAGGHLYSTSRMNASNAAASIFLSSGLGSDVPAADHSAPNDFGMVASIADLSSNHTPAGQSYGDGSPRSRTLNVNITRFKNDTYAATAIGKAQAMNRPIVWFSSKRVPLHWSGVPGEAGAHHLYDLGIFGAQESYLAVQIVGPYVVSADSSDSQRATQAVTSMVANLHSARLVK